MTTNIDANIPVLTEVIAVAKQPESATAPTIDHPPSQSSPSTPAAATAALDAAQAPNHLQAAIAQLSTREWEQLEQRLAERVLKQLQGRVEFVLEQRVRDTLADVLQLALVGLTGEIKRGLQQTLEEVIARAVQQEISRLKSLKK